MKWKVLPLVAVRVRLAREERLEGGDVLLHGGKLQFRMGEGELQRVEALAAVVDVVGAAVL